MTNLTDDELIKIGLASKDADGIYDFLVCARAIAAAEREAIMLHAQVILTDEINKTPPAMHNEHPHHIAAHRIIDAIRSRSVSGSQSGMCQCGSNLPPYAPCICFDSKSPRSET